MKDLTKYKELFKMLPDEQAGELIKSIIELETGGVLGETSILTEALITIMYECHG